MLTATASLGRNRQGYISGQCTFPDPDASVRVGAFGGTPEEVATRMNGSMQSVIPEQIILRSQQATGGEPLNINELWQIHNSLEKVLAERGIHCDIHVQE